MKDWKLTGKIYWEESADDLNSIPSSEQAVNSTLSPGATQPQWRKGSRWELGKLLSRLPSSDPDKNTPLVSTRNC